MFRTERQNFKNSMDKTYILHLQVLCVLLWFTPSVVVLGAGGPGLGRDSDPWATANMVYDEHHDHNHGVHSRIMDEDYNGNVDDDVRFDDVRRDVE